MKSFQEIRNIIVQIGEQNSACSTQLERAKNSQSFSDLLAVVKDNANWCYANKILGDDVLSQIPDSELTAAGIYYKKSGVVQREGFNVYHSSTSEHYGSSTSKHYGSSTSKHYGSSTSEHYGSSTSEHYHSSTSKHYGSSTSKHYGSSTSEHYHSSTSKHYDSSTSKHYGSFSFGSVYSLSDQSVIKDQAVIRERSTGKVYFRKGAFEIVELLSVNS